ncbi:hypothetical protein KFU94_58680 [Chloroflexi bacterium TSY]|nr:hypothetical protein [Chloroflexi bacterium TSY]
MQLLFVSSTSLLYETVEAHGGGVPQLSNVEVGPYWVTIWTQPDPLRVGIVHFTVAVTEGVMETTSGESSGTVVVDASVQITSESLSESRRRIHTYATHEKALNKLFYEADINLPFEKWWLVTVAVSGPAGEGTANFNIEVFPARSVNWFLVLSTALVVLMIIGLNRIWNQRRETRHLYASNSDAT